MGERFFLEIFVYIGTDHLVTSEIERSRDRQLKVSFGKEMDT